MPKKYRLYSYENYLSSSYWIEKRKQILKRTNKCELCGNDWKIVIHHKRYSDEKGNILGREKLSDLLVMCLSCHKLWHNLYNINTIMTEDIIKKIQISIKERIPKYYAFVNACE